MKILVIAPHPFFQERGTPIADKLLIETLIKFGHQINLLTFNEGDNIIIEGLKIFRIPNLTFLHNFKIGFSVKKLLADILMTFKLIKLLNRYNYDVIHAVEESIFMAVFLNKFYKKKLVYDMDSSMSDQLIEKWKSLNKIKGFLESFEKWAAINSTVVIPVCNYLASKISDYDTHKKIQILEDIAFDPDYSKDKKEDLKSYFDDGKLIGLYVGNLEHYQGIDLLLEGLSKLQTNFPYGVALIGGNDESINSYKMKAKKLGISEKVKFLGKRPIDQLPFLLKQADILFSPRTKGKNTPMKVYSYLASGVPILATNIDSHTQAMSKRESKLFNPNPESFAKAFKELLENTEERKILGNAGKKLAEEKYSLRSYEKKLKEIYDWLETA
ncbi:MAG: glycosyltransferase [Melioribacteraceae bacterium]